MLFVQVVKILIHCWEKRLMKVDYIMTFKKKLKEGWTKCSQDSCGNQWARRISLLTYPLKLK